MPGTHASSRPLIPHRAGRVPAALLAVLAVGLAAFISAALWFQRAPEPPPVPPALGSADALVRAAADGAIGSVRKAPRSADAWLALARVFHANGFSDDAHACYTRTLVLDAGNAPALYGRALLDYESGRIDDAFADLDRALAADPRYAPGFWRRARWLIDAGHADKAAADLDRADALEPGHRATRTLRAEVLLAAGHAGEALRLLETGLSPADAWSQRVYADALRRLGRADEALIAAARAHGRRIDVPDPRRTETLNLETGLIPAMGYAERLASAGRQREAIAAFENLRRQFPDNATLAANLATQYAAAGRTADALRMLDDAQGRVSGAANLARIEFGRMLVLMTAGRHAEALAAADRSLGLLPDFGLVLMERGRILAAENRLPEAIASLQAASEAMADDGLILQIKGETELRAGRPEDAALSFTAATNRDPLLVRSWLLGAILLAEAGRAEDARRALHMARLVDPSDPALAEAERRVEASVNGENP